MSYELCIYGMDIEVEVDSYYGGCPAKLNGLPEDCYPEEGPEVEWVLAEDTTEFVEIAVDSNSHLQETITEQLLEAIAEENY